MPVTFSTDLSGRITSWSEGARMALGYEPQELMGKPLAALFPEEDVEKGVPQRLLETARKQGSASLAGWRVGHAGERVFMLGEMNALFGAELELVGFTVVLLPSPVATKPGTGRAARRRQLAIEQPDPATLAEAFTRSDERFYVLDDNLDFVYLNDQAAQAWGVDRERLVGQNLITSFPQVLDTEFLAAHVQVATEGVSVKLESVSPLNGRKVELSIFPNRNGGVAVLIRDPFDRAAAPSNLVGDERLAEAYAALEIAVLEWEPASGEFAESDGAADIFGLAPDERLVSRERQLELLHPTDLSSYSSIVDRAVQEGEGWRLEYRAVRPVDGEMAWLEEVARVSRSDGDGLKYSITVWDVTIRKLAEEESRSSQRQLQKELVANRRLQEILVRANSADEPQEALSQVVVAACELFAAPRGCVRLLVPQDAKLRIVAQRGYPSAYLDVNAAVPFEVAEFDSCFQLDEAGNYQIMQATATGFGGDVRQGEAYSERWVPLVGLNGRVVGLLSLEWHRPYAFNERDELDLAVLASLAATLADRHLLEQRSRDAIQRLEQQAAAHGAELMQSEIRFRRAFEVGPVASVITTVAEDRFIEVNDGYVKLTGYAPSEVVGRTSRELGMWSSREDQTTLEDAFAQGGGFRELQLRLRTKDGRVRDILLSGERIVYRGQDSWLKMFNDVTEQHRSQEELMGAIRQVMSDAEWFSQSVVQKLAEIRHGPVESVEFDLTSRELQVLKLVAAGLDDDEIGDSLGISRKTVRNHLTNVYAKTGVHSRSEAIIWARDRGIMARSAGQTLGQTSQS